MPKLPPAYIHPQVKNYNQNLALFGHVCINLNDNADATLMLAIEENLDAELLYAPLEKFVKALSVAILETAFRP